MATLSKDPRRAKASPGGEVDQALGVGVVHRDQVHDHRLAVAEALTDGAGLVVVLRAQRGDLRQRAALLEEHGHPAGVHGQRAAGGSAHRAEPRRAAAGPAGARTRGRGTAAPLA